MIVRENIRLLIPAYNVENYLDELICEVSKYLPVKNILVVDDGSNDRTAEIARNQDVDLIVHEKNLGKGAALLSGFDYLIERGSEWVITMDGDLQHDPASLPEFIERAVKGNYDLVIGERKRNAGGMPWDRRFSNFTTSLLLSLASGQRIRDSQCGYRLIRCNILKDIEIYSSGYEFETECLLKLSKAGARIGWIEIPTRYRGAASSINRFRDTLRFLKVYLRFIITG